MRRGALKHRDIIDYLKRRRDEAITRGDFDDGVVLNKRIKELKDKLAKGVENVGVAVHQRN